jgi:hypothetical protein
MSSSKEELKNVYKVLFANTEEGLDGMIILIWILNKHDLSMWNGFNQFRANDFQFSTEGIITQCYFN